MTDPFMTENQGKQTIDSIMAESIESAIQYVLHALANEPRSSAGDAWVGGEELEKTTGLSPPKINDAVALLAESGMAESFRAMGTAPFDFVQVQITPRGRYEWERMKSAQTSQLEHDRKGLVPATAIRPPTPVGSPYGFTDMDWEIVSQSKSKADELRVVLGHPFQSEHFNVSQLEENVKAMFTKAVEDYVKKPGSIPVHLHFVALSAGYGEHLFNEIARDIISSDIAVFDTSDLNANVMLEMGVALTWGVRVLPIRNEKCPRPPSDISGQTYADYLDSAREFTDQNHHEKLLAMIERAIRKKGAHSH